MTIIRKLYFAFAMSSFLPAYSSEAAIKQNQDQDAKDTDDTNLGIGAHFHFVMSDVFSERGLAADLQYRLSKSWNLISSYSHSTDLTYDYKDEGTKLIYKQQDGKSQTIHLGLQYTIGTSFYISSSVFHKAMEKDLVLTNLSSGSPISETPYKLSADQTGLDLAIGNEWNIFKNLSLQIEWIGFELPLAKTFEVTPQISTNPQHEAFKGQLESAGVALEHAAFRILNIGFAFKF